MPKFEYKLHRLPAAHPDAPINQRVVKDEGKPDRNVTLIDDLNALGQEGWEIVFAWPGDTHVLLKREATGTPNAQPKSPA